MKMKSLGIVRRIDELGRIVIPKEIRDGQGWKAHHPLEMFLSDEGLVIRSFSAENTDVVPQLEFLKWKTENEDDRRAFEKVIEIIKKQEG